MEEEKQPNWRHPDHFSRLMFGAFPPRQAEDGDKKAEPSSLLQDINFIQLAEDIGTIASSFRRLKPLISDLLKK
jgi:hypothetical protein